MNHRELHFKIPGKIVYTPTRGYDKSGRPVLDPDRCTIQIPGRELCKYYAYQFYKKFGIQLLEPSWEPHVTVIANKTFNRSNNEWGYKNGERVMIEYSHQMFWNHEHVWIAAECPEIDELRSHYGNPRYDRGHLTIGKFRDNDVRKLPSFKKFEDIELWHNYIWNKPL